MRGLKTDKELLAEKAVLEKELGELLVERNRLEDEINRTYDLWRAAEDKIMKREIHKEIFKMKDEVRRMNYGRINILKNKLFSINKLLYPSQSTVIGCIYDTYRSELDFNDIIINGIRGVKL